MKNAELKVIHFGENDVIATSGWVSINKYGNNTIGDIEVSGSKGSATGYEAAAALYGNWNLYRTDIDTTMTADGAFETDTWDEDDAVIGTMGDWNGTYVWDPTGNGGSGWYKCNQ